MQLPGGSRGKGPQLIQNSIASPSLRVRGFAKSLSHAGGGRAKIAHSAARTGVRRVPEVMNQRRHPALMALREADDLLQLALFLLRLKSVGTPPILYATAHIFRKIHDRAFVNPELLQDPVEDILFHRDQLADRVFALRVSEKHSKNAVQQRNRRV